MLSGKAMSFINNPEAPLLNAGLPENELFVIKDQDLLKVSPADFSGGYIGIVSDSILTQDLLDVAGIAAGFGVTAAFQAPCELFGHQVCMARTDKFSPELNQELKKLSGKRDAVHVRDFPKLTAPGVILLDMDSTCIQCECIDEIAKAWGVGAQISEITSQAMHGLLDFKQSLRKRVGLLKGAPAQILWDLRDRLPIMPGFPELIHLLQFHGWKTAIASGGFMTFVNRLKEEFGLTLVRANTFRIVDGHLTGELEGDIVDSSVKVTTMNELLDRYGIPPAQSIAIGDGANDLPMINAAGIGFAIHAKPIVREKAPATINNFGLDAAACLLKGAELIDRIK
ncbi:MAG: phosphoserine phosphatase SerB [Succinimonas sp.]|nr:phosphoserine phosphatase SerB [Succinimonas sp.]